MGTYKREEFVTLIVNLRTKVDDLAALISVAELRPVLRRMQIEDAEEVQSKDAKEMKLVEDSARNVDPAFGLLVEQARLGHSFSNTDIGDYSAVQMGDSVTAEYSGSLSKHIIPTQLLGSARMHRCPWATCMEGQCSIRPCRAR